MKYLILLIYALLSNSALVIMKMGANKGMLFSLKSGLFSLQISLYSIMGFILYISSFLLYIYLISKNNLTYIIPITSAISHIFIFIASILILKETITLYQGAGFFLIMIGVILMNLK